MLIKPILPAALTVAAAAAPAAHAAQQHYSVTAATGQVQVSFSGTPAAGCAARASCGTSGTVVYAFSGTPSHTSATLTSGRRGVTGVRALFRTAGRTRANVDAPGRATPCSDRVTHRQDGFALRRRGSKLAFTLHRGGGDYFATSCAGPSEADLAKLGAVPTALFKPSGFAHPNFHFGLTGSHDFVRGGYQGTVRWKLKYRLVSVTR